MKQSKYNCIDCATYEKLELYILKKMKVKMRYYRRRVGDLKLYEGLLLDLKTQDGSEYVIIENKEYIRLDYISGIELVNHTV